MNTKKETQETGADLTAIILAASHDTSVFGPEGFPVCMLPLANRPALQHAIELAVAAGAEQLHVIVSEATEVIGAFLNKGERWGVQAQTHLARNASMGYAHLSAIAAANSDSKLLILHCETLPPALPDGAVSNHKSTTVFVHGKEWTGAAIIQGGHIPALREWSREEFDTFLEQPEHDSQLVEVGKPLSIQTGAKLLKSQGRILSKDCGLPTQNLRTAEPGIWIGRNTRLHPTTRLHPPVMIGANCDIAAHVDIGPNVVIADNCIIDKAVNAKNSLVLEHTAVGEGLELKDVILAGQRLHNTRINATIDVRDNILLGDLSRRDVRESLAKFASRLTATMLLVTFLPALLVVMAVLRLWGKSPRLTKRQIVETPAPEHTDQWKTRAVWEVGSQRQQPESPNSSPGLMWQDLLKRVVPGCWAVASGSISLTGISHRSEEEFREVPTYWRRDLLLTRSGLISESLVQYGPRATSDQSCTADMWYAMAPGRAKQFRLLARYAKALIQGPLAVELVDRKQTHTEQTEPKRTYANSKEVCDVECV